MKPADPPDIDPRDTTAVARQTSALAEKLTGWSPGRDADAGTALIGAFASMAQQVITRLNQMPNRHFLAYLRMLGLQPRPPRAADVPLTFTAAAGARGVRVPAGTQVRGQHADGTRATFYTSAALELLPNREPILWRAITYQPPDNDGSLDCVSVDTAMATGKEAGYYGLFTADEPVEHAVYLAADDVLTIAAATVQLSIAFPLIDGAPTWQSLQQSGTVVWEYFSDEDEWKLFTPSEGSVSPDGYTYTFQLFDSRPSDMTSCALSVAQEMTHACWIRARLTAWPSYTIPDWCDMALSAMSTVPIPEFTPEQVLFNGVPIDTSKDYYPLGRQPAFNDCCTLVLGALPNALDTTLTVQVTTSEEVENEGPDPCGKDSPTLAWEIGSGDTWHTLSPDSDPPSLVFDPDDSAVSVLKASGKAQIPLSAVPAGISQPALRIRLASGNYGTGITVSDEITDDGYRITTDDGYRPPILHEITISGIYIPSATPVCVTDNGEGRRVENFAQPVMPFWLRADTEPAFYLAFGEALGQASVSMYLQVSPLSCVTLSDVKDAKNKDAKNKAIAPAQVAWEYSAASTDPAASTDWKVFQVEDGTHDFTQSGFLRFVAPADHARSAQFGSVPLYWLRARQKLRARLKSGDYAVPPQGGLVLPNSVAAANARTIRDEVLGSSHQTPGQTFGLVHTPILDDAELIVREPVAPPADEIAQLRAAFGPLAVMPATACSGARAGSGADDTAELGAVWVRWKQIGSFAASRPQDRHYTLDHDDGTVVFGDGDNGKVPPAGKNNIVMTRYASGGGVVGNLPAGSINKLVNAVAHVAAVDNRVASSGGADGEDNAAVMDWGPRMLRHRGRATARQDYEDLVRQAFPQIAKVSAVTPSFDPSEGPGNAQGAGHVLVVVVPDDDSDRPAPPAGLLQQIDDYLRTCMPPAVQLSLSGPDWLEVSVKVKVTANSMERTGALKDEVEQGLRRFLNPLTGGFDRKGWALGQMVYDSDITRYLLALPGVDSVVGDVIVSRSPAVTKSGSPVDMPELVIDQRLTVVLVCSGTHDVTVQGSA